jgi:beta-glucosidase
MVVKEAQPWTVMCAYNRINGVYASQNDYLLNQILRDEWGFRGVVVSDWTANHTIFESVQAGLDLEMPGPANYYGKLLELAVDHWQVDEAVIDKAARRILEMIYKTGKLTPEEQRPIGSVNTVEHQNLARQLSEEAITLLKNDNGTLPLNLHQINTLAIIGPNAVDMQISGGGSSCVPPSYMTTPLQVLQTRLGEHLEIRYEQGCDNFVELPTLKNKFLTLENGRGTGLLGEYYNNTTLEGIPELVRIDDTINFWWYFHGPAENISVQKFSARWTGLLTVPESGEYTIKLNNSGMCRLYMDDKLLIDITPSGELSRNNPQLNSSCLVHLIAGQSYRFRVEFFKSAEEPLAHVKVMMTKYYRQGEDQRLINATRIASQSDVAIVFVGMPEFYESEGDDRPDMELPGSQNELIHAVAKANPHTIVVMNAGAPVNMPWLDEVQGLVTMFYPGLEGANAITRVLLGEVNPSGKLSVTYPRRLEDAPAFINYPGSKEVHYGEGIFVGYRYYDTRDIEPLFPFGYGLSYTSFTYSDLQVSSPIKNGEPINVSINIKNTGNITGKEIVQLYIHDKQASHPRPPKELKGFSKIELQPGEVQTVHFSLNQRALSYFNPDEKRWIAEIGEFEVLVGSSSRDIRAKALLVLE